MNFPLSQGGASRRPIVVFLPVAIGLVLLGAALGWLGHQRYRTPAAPTTLMDEGIALKDGPWGDLYYTPFNLTAPDELLPVSRYEEGGTRWVFQGMGRAALTAFLESLKLPAGLQQSLASLNALEEATDGCVLHPTVDEVFAIPAEARLPLYREIAKHAVNRSQFTYIHKDTLPDRFSAARLSEGTMTLFKQLCCEFGDYYVFAGLPALLSKLPSYQEKLALVRALTLQKTMTLRLLIKPGQDTSAIADYWGRGMWSTDVHTILASMAHSEHGGALDILSVLPPLPSSQLYFYPKPDNPLKGPAPNRDCHWTAFNFFKDEPENRFGDAAEVISELRSNYLPLSGDPRYGDVVMLGTPNGDVIHSAVYIADNIVFTKNGATVLYPWMLSTIPDLLKQYSFQVEPGQQLTVNYFRAK